MRNGCGCTLAGDTPEGPDPGCSVGKSSHKGTLPFSGLSSSHDGSSSCIEDRFARTRL